MATTPTVILDALNGLLYEEFEDFKWHLLNGGLTDSSIPRGKLEEAKPRHVAYLMVQQYKSDAGNIAVRALRNIGHNNHADQLERKLQKVQEDVPAGGGASSGGTGGASSGGTGGASSGGTGGASSGGSGGTAQTTEVAMNINSSGGTVKAPVVHGAVFNGPVNFN